MTIWKYPLVLGDHILPLPRGATVLSVQLQDDEPMLWALVDPKAPLQPRRFRTVGTGWEIPASWAGTHLATLQRQGFVWHVFEVP